MKVFDILDDFKEVTDKFSIVKSKYWILLPIEEIGFLKEKFFIDEESLKECREFDNSLKISFFDKYTFILLNILEFYNMKVHSRELDIFLAENYLITVYKEELDTLNNLLRDIKISKDCFLIKQNPSTSILLYYILDRIIVKNYNVISSLETEGDKIEISILKNPKHEHIDRLINLRRQVYKIRKNLSPLRYIGDSLISNDNFVIEKENLIYFINLSKKVDKLMITLDSLVQDLAMVREAFESEIANKTNELMKVFTLISSIFLPLNLLTSIQGMNMKNIPFSELEHGYYYVIILMLGIVVYLIYLFKKKKWL